MAKPAVTSPGLRAWRQDSEKEYRVAKFDRYLLSQLLTLFGFFSLVLVAVYWVNRAVSLFDDLISDGQSVLVFVEFSLMTLPNVIHLVLPIAAFAAAVYVTNRLSQDSELVVMQATGFSSFRLARPVLLFGFCTALMMAILGNYLVPESRARLAIRTTEVSSQVTSRFLRDGQFMHPGANLTLYIGQISQNGELHDMFLSDQRDPKEKVTYSARRAIFVNADSGPKLIMFEGSVQTLDLSTDRLAFTRFSDFTYDLSDFATEGGGGGRAIYELSTAELLRADPAALAETGKSRATFLEEGHARIAQPFLAAAAAMIGFATLLLGGFSRFGLWYQIGISIFLLIVVQMVWTSTAAQAMQHEGRWPLVYVAPVFGMVLAGIMLWLSQKPRPRGRAAAGAFTPGDGAVS
jgi:lipopolysaccharide export system permease protein